MRDLPGDVGITVALLIESILYRLNMNYNMTTISNILPQTNIPDLSSRILNKEKGNSRFFIEQENRLAQTDKADNIVDIRSSREQKRSDESAPISQKQQEAKNSDKSLNKDIPRENNEVDNSNQNYKSPAEPLENRDNGNIEPKNASETSEYLNQSEDEITQSLQKDENLTGLRDQMSEQSIEEFGLRIYSDNINDTTVNVQADEQNKNIENTLIRDKLVNVSNTTTKKGAGLGESEIQTTGGKTNNEIQAGVPVIKETDKESIVDGKGKYPVNDGKAAILEDELIKDKAKDLISQKRIDESGIKEALLNSRNSDNDQQSDVAQGVVESTKIKESILSLNMSKDDSAVQKIEINNLQLSAGQAKKQGDSSSDNKANSVISQIASNNTFATEQNNSSISNVRIVNQTQQGTSEDVSANVGKQILESIHSSMGQRGGDKQITVNLNPPELGQVSIKFQEQGAQLNGLLEVSKTQTRTEIEQALPQIIRNLSDSGINIKRLEVILTTDDQTGKEAMREDSLFYNQQQQQDFNNPSLYGGNRDMTGFHEWMASNINSIGNPGLSDSLAVENSINILI